MCQNYVSGINPSPKFGFVSRFGADAFLQTFEPFVSRFASRFAWDKNCP